MQSSVIAPRPRALHSTTQSTLTTLGTAFITITADETGAAFEAFVNVGKAGSDTFAVAEGLGRLVSLILRMPSSLSRRERAAQIVEQLSSVGGVRQPVHALPDALAVALAEQIQLSKNHPLGLNVDRPADVSAGASSRSGRPPETAAPPTADTGPGTARPE